MRCSAPTDSYHVDERVFFSSLRIFVQRFSDPPVPPVWVHKSSIFFYFFISLALTVDGDLYYPDIRARDVVGGDAFIWAGLLFRDGCQLQVLSFRHESLHSCKRSRESMFTFEQETATWRWSRAMIVDVKNPQTRASPYQRPPSSRPAPKSTLALLSNVSKGNDCSLHQENKTISSQQKHLSNTANYHRLL